MVTLGFRCSPELKSSLSLKASDNNITLSQFVNQLVSNADILHQELVKRVSQLDLEKQSLEKKISKYETPELMGLFAKCKGERAKFKDSNGVSKEVVVNTIFDLQEIITKSFLK